MRVPDPDLLRNRRARLAQALSSIDLPALLVTSLPNVTYLTGFTGSSGVVLASGDGCALMLDGRYADAGAALAAEQPDLALVPVPLGSSYEPATRLLLQGWTGRRVGVEAAHLTLRQHQALAGGPGAGPELVPTFEVVEQLRAVKDRWELQVLREAAARLSECAARILPKPLEGRTERDVALELEWAIRTDGFARLPFEIIVAAGVHAARPHHRPTARRIEAGELVVIDFGGVLDGYAVDVTRTLVAGRPGARERAVIDAVVHAQQAALDCVQPGAAPEQVDAAARSLLGKLGFADAFAHSTGHGLGLDVHERPRVGPPRSSGPEPPLAAGMVLTLEPGVYFPGWGGARHEDDFVVTATGAERLTTLAVQF